MRFSVPYAAPLDVVLRRHEKASRILLRRNAFVDVVELPRNDVKGVLDYRYGKQSSAISLTPDGAIRSQTYALGPRLPHGVLAEMPEVRSIVADHGAESEAAIVDRASRTIYSNGLLHRQVEIPFIGIVASPKEVRLEIALEGCPPAGFAWSFAIADYEQAKQFVEGLAAAQGLRRARTAILPEYFDAEKKFFDGIAHDPRPARMLHAGALLLDRTRSGLAAMETDSIHAWTALRDQLAQATRARPYDAGILGSALLDAMQILGAAAPLSAQDREIIATAIDDGLSLGSEEDMDGLAGIALS